MDPQTLVLEGSKKAVALCCGKCGIIFNLESRAFAEQCCVKPKCNRCGGEIEGRGWAVCDACRDKKYHEEEADRFTKAQKLTLAEYDGLMLFNEVFGNEGFVNTAEVEDELGYLREDGKGLPEFAWACNGRGLKLNAEDILESELERGEFHEDAREHLPPTEELQKAMDLWTAKTPSELTFFPDRSRAVLLGDLVVRIESEGDQE